MALTFWEVVASGAVGATVAAGVQLAKERWLLDVTLGLQQKHEQRKKLHELQSRYMGRVLEAALDWDRRMTQLYKGAYRVQLDPPDECRGKPEYYYFHSVIFRFLQLTAIARRFEAEAFYIDPAIAKPQDFDLLRYSKAFLWVMIHAELSPDDGQPGKDHFRSDAFRPLLDLCYGTPTVGEGENARPLLPETRSRDGDLIFDLKRYMALVGLEDPIIKSYVDELLAFFDGVRPNECDGARQRRRWDRLVALHLICLAFLDRRGYEWQHGGLEEQASTAVGMLLYPEVLHAEFESWLPRLGLAGDEHMNTVRGCLAEAVARRGEERPAERARRVIKEIRDSSTRDALPAHRTPSRPEPAAAATASAAR